MELNEISTISYPIRGSLIPFSLARSNNDQFCLTTRQSAQILNLCFKHNDDANLNFIKTTYKIPTSMPTSQLNACHETIYNRATDAQKQELTLDVLLMPQLSQLESHNICFTSVKWSPPSVTLKNEAYLAGLTNYGGCNICYRQDDERHWIEIANISDLWLDYCQNLKKNEKILKYEKLKEMVRDVHITAIDWNNICIKNQCGLAIVSGSGKLVFFDVAKQSATTSKCTVEQKFVYETGQYKVNVLKWLSYYDGNDTLKSMVLLGDLSGNLQIYNVVMKDGSIEDVVKATTLWNYNDEQKFSELYGEFNYGTKQFTIVACKGSFVHVFILNSIGKLIRNMSQYVPNLFVTGKFKRGLNNFTKASNVHNQVDYLNRSSDFRTEMNKIDHLVYHFCPAYIKATVNTSKRISLKYNI